MGYGPNFVGGSARDVPGVVAWGLERISISAPPLLLNRSGVVVADPGVGDGADDDIEMLTAAGGVGGGGAVGVAVDLLPGAVLFVAEGGAGGVGIGVAAGRAVGAISGDEFGAEGEHQRRFEIAGVAGEAAAAVGVGGDEGVPGDVPVRAGGGADGVFEDDVADGELHQLCVAAVAVQQEDALEAIADEGFDEFVEDEVVSLRGEGERAAEDEVVVGGAEGESGGDNDGDVGPGDFGGAAGDPFDGEEVHAGGQMGAVLFGGADGEDDEGVRGEGADLFAVQFGEEFHGGRLGNPSTILHGIMRNENHHAPTCLRQ